MGANPVDRAKRGSKLHLAVEGGGLPLSVLVTGANTNDGLVFEALLDDLPAVRPPAGRRTRIRYHRDSERFFAFAMLACDRLCYNRLPCAITARLP